jgi:segregation and condensation protein B
MARAKKKPTESRPTPPPAGFAAPPSDSGLSIDKLAQAFAAMMGAPDPRAIDDPTAAEVVEVNASPDLDADDDPAAADDACRVSPLTILEALLFVGLSGGKPLSSRTVAGMMRGVRPQEVDDLAEQLRARYLADNCPYEVAAKDDGWVMRLRPEFARLGGVLEAKVRAVRLDAESLDVLAAVAWNEPVPRDKLVELGCDAGPAVLRNLVRRGLLDLRHEEGGEPCYRTTPRFLEVFKLEGLHDLPSPNDPPQ